MDLESALDRLYAVGLEEFTSTRNRLSSELASGGDKTAGAQIKALKKPNIAAWTLNQLARSHQDQLDELFAATDRVRRAHRRALSGGKATDLRDATDSRNRVVSKLTKIAATILVEAGHSAAQSTLSSISDSFMAVASDDIGADLLRKGRLFRELQPGAIVDVAGLTLVPDGDDDAVPAAKPDQTVIQAARVKVNEARQKVKDANEALRDADTEAWKVSGEADEAERRAKSAREAAEFAKRAAEARKAEAEAAAKVLEEAQEELKRLDESP